MSQPGLRECGWRWLPLTAVLIILDQWSKAWIESRYFLGEYTPIFVWLDLTRLHNPGAAFSFLADAGGWQRWFFSVFALIVSGVLVIWLRRLHQHNERLLVVALACILGGAIGNVIDRLQHGYVVDFIHLHWGAAYFPAFNVADMAISVGAILILIDAFRDWRAGRGEVS